MHSTAEYCAPVWCRSAHTRLIDPAINDALRVVTGCLRLTPADNLPTLAGIQPAELRRSGATLSLARRAVEPGHLLHSALARPSSADARRLKSRHPFIHVAQHLISFSDNNNISAAHWVDHQWNAEWADNPAWPPPHRCWTFPLLLVQMGHGFLCGLWVRHRRTNKRPCCPRMSNPSTSPWTTWPDGSGRWDNRMASEHLPRDLVRPSSGLNN